MSSYVYQGNRRESNITLLREFFSVWTFHPKKTKEVIYCSLPLFFTLLWRNYQQLLVLLLLCYVIPNSEFKVLSVWRIFNWNIWLGFLLLFSRINYLLWNEPKAVNTVYARWVSLYLQRKHVDTLFLTGFLKYLTTRELNLFWGHDLKKFIKFIKSKQKLIHDH